MYGWSVGSHRLVSFVRPRVVALGALLSVVAAASTAEALTISNPGGNVSIPAGTSGDPNLVVTAGGTTTFAGRADADSLVVSSVGAIIATAGEISAVQATFLTTGANITLSNALNSIDRATLDTSNNTGAVGDISFDEQQGIILDLLRGRVVRVASTGGTITVTTRIRATGALTLQTTAGNVAIAGDTELGANSKVAASGNVALSGSLGVPALRTGYALQVVGVTADVNVALDVGALGFVPTTETRLHVFAWAAATRTASVSQRSFPALPAGMTWDLSEISTSGDLVIRVCGDGSRAVTEQCDDGNTVSGDGCDSTCHIEPPGPPDAGPDAAAPDSGASEDAGPDATAPDASDRGDAGDAGADAGYGGKGGLIDESGGSAAEIDIEGGACSFGAASGASGGALASVGLGLAALARRRRRSRLRAATP